MGKKNFVSDDIKIPDQLENVGFRPAKIKIFENMQNPYFLHELPTGNTDKVRLILRITR